MTIETQSGKRIAFPRPTEKQKAFLRSRAKYTGFGGARGGGKSFAVRYKAKLLALKYAGIQILIVRRTYPELKNNHIRTLKKELLGIASYNDNEKLLTFENGSTIGFSYCARDADLDRLQGTEYDVIFLDEATQLSEYQIKSITACLRGVNEFPKRIYFTCNPGGQGHAYIKRIFVDRKYEKNEKPEEFLFIQSKVTDNKPLMASQPDYIEQLEALPPKLRRAWLDGDWNVFEGQFFEEFTDAPEHYKDRRFTHVIDPFEPPAGWTVYRSFDWGYARPFSCAWWAIDYDGMLYRILEYYGCTGTPNEGVRKTPDEVFREIHRIEVEHPWLRGRRIYGIADPAIWDAESGVSIAETAERYHVFFDPGDHKRIPGWMQCHYRLQFDENGYPRMYVFKNCKDFIRTVPLLQFDEHKVEDINTAMEDHIADEWRYMCMARPILPRRQKERRDLQSDPLYAVFGLTDEELHTDDRNREILIFDENEENI